MYKYAEEQQPQGFPCIAYIYNYLDKDTNASAIKVHLKQYMHMPLNLK